MMMTVDWYIGDDCLNHKAGGELAHELIFLDHADLISSSSLGSLCQGWKNTFI